MLGGAGAATRDRIIEAYPDYPARKACVRIGGDFAFGAASWQVAEARAAVAPTYVYRYDYAPRPLHWSGLGPPMPPNCSQCSTSTAPDSVPP